MLWTLYAEICFHTERFLGVVYSLNKVKMAVSPPYLSRDDIDGDGNRHHNSFTDDNFSVRTVKANPRYVWMEADIGPVEVSETQPSIQYYVYNPTASTHRHIIW